MLPCVLLQAVLCVGQPPDANPMPSALPIIQVQTEQPEPSSPVPEKERQPVEVTAPLLPPAAATPAAPAPAPAAVPPDRWLLMKALQGTWEGDELVGNRTQVYGWTEGSYTYGSEGRGAWPMLAQSPTNEFLMNQNWLIVERTVVTTGTTEPTYGFHTAWILPGSDARYTVSRHLLDEQHGVNDFTHSAYPIDLFHAYGEGFFPTIGRGLDIKIGKNAVPYFAETEDQVFNPLFSHSYIFYYGGPFTHTGLQANLKLTDEWAIETRLVVGDDIFLGPGDQPTFVGALSWTQPGGGRNTALLSVVAGSGRYDLNNAQNNLNLLDLVYTHNFNPLLKYTLDAVAGYETNVSTIAPTGRDTAWWYGAAQYLTYTLTPRLAVTGRFELFDDPEGLRTGFEGLYEALTLGVTFKPRRQPSGTGSFLIRPEIRYDYNGDSRPYDNNNDPQHGQLSLAADVIVRW